jgi:hypothetical protein
VTHLVRFRLKARALHLDVSSEEGEATFTVGDVRLTIGRDGSNEESPHIDAETSLEAPDDVLKLLGEQAENMLRARDARLGTSARMLSVAEVTWLVDPPPPVVAFCEGVALELHQAASRLVGLLRWIFNRPWTPHPLHDPCVEWSLDGERWQPAPTRPVNVVTFGGDGVDLGPKGQQALQRLLEDHELAEPLARQIFLEAVSLQEDEPRTSVVIALVAAETGVKQFAIRQTPRPSEKWLISETAYSPSFLKILREYLPKATERRTADGRVVPLHLQEILERAVDTRNNIVHGGGDAPDEEQVAELLAAVNDLLYLLRLVRRT